MLHIIGTENLIYMYHERCLNYVYLRVFEV